VVGAGDNPVLGATDNPVPLQQQASSVVVGAADKPLQQQALQTASSVVPPAEVWPFGRVAVVPPAALLHHGAPPPRLRGGEGCENCRGCGACAVWDRGTEVRGKDELPFFRFEKRGEYPRPAHETFRFSVLFEKKPFPNNERIFGLMTQVLRLVLDVCKQDQDRNEQWGEEGFGDGRPKEEYEKRWLTSNGRTEVFSYAETREEKTLLFIEVRRESNKETRRRDEVKKILAEKIARDPRFPVLCALVYPLVSTFRPLQHFVVSVFERKVLQTVNATRKKTLEEAIVYELNTCFLEHFYDPSLFGVSCVGPLLGNEMFVRFKVSLLLPFSEHHVREHLRNGNREMEIKVGAHMADILFEHESYSRKRARTL
jgi:hypothetical protein